ncbi:Actin-like protein [Neofusicoccum parvum]|uniref:Actin-like protein n=2 Tax=Neofusicoccum parvum TaxID=310453 RepID=A0ACB5SI24_9PEZI|nr:putative chromatin remodeling complex subunit protein [Neofusicoccum parvum UCRNP2]GME42112.1 Actin-like protein [Neofusicoccum parvum]GME58191.1 Actin-like protein [Neofusicoccum parvum]
MVIARKWPQNEAEEDGGEPLPKRIKIDGEEQEDPDKWFGEEFSSQYNGMSNDLKQHYILGQTALRIPEDSQPRYKLFWPIRYGWFNEQDYKTKNQLYQDVSLIIEHAIISELGLKHKKDWFQYGCVCVIPDLFERNYVTQMLEILLRDLGFGRVCFQQESLSATFGAGYSSSCIVDIGAQKTSVCCVDEGMCLEDSRVNVKYGGADVMETFIRMMLHDYFPYSDINLKRRYDLLLAEELKQKFCTMNEADISVQLYDFHLRAFGEDTRKYFFKCYDETMLAPMPPRETPAVGGAPGEGGSFGATSIFFDPTLEKIKLAEERDKILPIAGLDTAIMTSIQQGARGDDRKARDFYGGIMVIGGGSKIAGFMPFLEDRLRSLLPGLGKDILIGAPPRDLDPQVLVWKGGSVFGKLSTSGNDSWISQKEYDILGSRLLMNKCMFLW